MQSRTIALYPTCHKALVGALTGCDQLEVQGLESKIEASVRIQVQVCRVVKAPDKQAKHKTETLSHQMLMHTNGQLTT